MLSEKVLADLTRSSPLLPALVTAAWPSLSTESRMQVIAEVQGSGVGSATPDWLLDLAQRDSAEIVRYWAARSAYFKEEGPIDFAAGKGAGGLLFNRKPPDPVDVERARRAREDSSQLVRLSVDRLGLMMDGDALTKMPQLQRLIAIRNSEHSSLSSFITWIGGALEAGVHDEELAECTEEFLANPDVIRQLKVDNFEDGLVAHVEGKAMAEGWQLIKEKAGKRLAMRLAFALPTERGLRTMKVTDFIDMPELVLDALVLRRGEDKVFMELADLVRTQPDRFPERVVKSLKRDDEDYFAMPTAEEKADADLRRATDRHAATLEAVLAIRGEIRKLQERLEEVYEAASRKRGIFG